MIQLLNKKYSKAIAYIFFILFYISWAAPSYAGRTGGVRVYGGSGFIMPVSRKGNYKNNIRLNNNKQKEAAAPAQPNIIIPRGGRFIGGPSQPEMSSFKSVSTDNMVNLFTGDFNYNIPLLDVGGYPVNIYYDGNIGMEQEASWVGLGWNINPGSVSRSVRGIPDDFDGTDIMKEEQYLKPNETWGGRLGADWELLGIKKGDPPKAENTFTGSIGFDIGASFNNYLGPALDLSVKGGINFNVGQKIQSEKSPGNDTVHVISAGLTGSATLSSRDGLTLSGSASLTGRAFKQQNRFDFGLSLSSSYNSRVGIKDMQLNGQMSVTNYMKRDYGAPKPPDPAEHTYSTGENIFSNTINFARPSYIPTIRVPMTNTAWSGHLQLGGGIFGIYPSIETEIYYQKSEVTNPVQLRPLVGYMYYQNAVNNPDAVMDFTRLGDKEVTVHTPVISAPQYTYDIFAVQGEGTGGTIRACRTDLGYMRDNFTGSSDNSVGVGADISIVPQGHYGGNFNIVKTPTTIGKWDEGNNLDGTVSFIQNKDVHELVYFRNPGESSVLDPGWFYNIGNNDLVRFQIGGDASAPTIEPTLLHYDHFGNKIATSPISNAANPTQRAKRSQVVTFLTAEEAARIGLDKTINSYSTDQPLVDAPVNGNHNFSLNCNNKIPRFGNGNYRLGHHISQINVTEGDGKRYIYGIPVYNTTQTDFTFSVTGVTNPDDDKVLINTDHTNWMEKTNTPFPSGLLNKDGIDGYLQSTTTPAYAHSFLLSGLLSPDYVDITGDGITEDDLGDAVKFNYSFMPLVHKWRTPLTPNLANNQPVSDANLNVGNRSETKDDKGIVSFGTREQWYLHSIESKTMVAIFTLADREDGKGALSETGGVDESDNTIKKLDHIDLYNKADLKANGLYNGTTGAGAKPIKTVWFAYSYTLCNGTPDNKNGGGKLTLDGIYFTFNGQQRTNKTQYVFSYTNTNSDDHSVTGNPSYQFNWSDRWGTYKPNPTTDEASAGVLGNPAILPNKDYPYSLQPRYNTSDGSINAADTAAINKNAGAWALKKILLPSGGQIEVSYESDDYAYVQNKHAAQMMQVIGFAHAVPTGPGNLSNALYDFTDAGATENNYVIIEVPKECAGATDALKNNDLMNTYLAGMSQFSFRYSVEMPKGEEYLTSYASLATEKDNGGNDIGSIAGTDYGALSSVTDASGKHNYIWIKMAAVNYKDDEYLSPLSLTALEYLREQLPGQAFPGYDLSEPGTAKFAGMLTGLLTGLKGAFKDPINYLRSRDDGARFVPGVAIGQGVNSLKCFVRLNNPFGFKYGGGSRVHAVILKDNWHEMTYKNNTIAGQYTSVYGQVYDYTTTETMPDGSQHTISSGVASYEPAIGGEENPFTSIVQYSDRLPLGPASYGSVEMPILDAFFPSPVVGYSKVTVRSLADVNAALNSKKTRSGIGRQVTEFYTAKDFPVYYNYTALDPTSDVQEHDASLLAFFSKHAFDSRALSQGFIVVTNDMHGKLKSQSSYSAADDKTRINYTENYYKNTGVNNIADPFDFVDASGAINGGNMGVDMELMTDARQFSVKSKSEELQLQFDFFPIIIPAWLPFPWPVFGKSQSYYRAVTTTKVINYHSVVEKVIVIDKGSQVTTQNLLRDAQTGEVVVNQTNNEFEQPIYTTTYPAYWAYSGMGPAYQNIDAVYSGVNFSNGLIITSGDNAGTPVPSGVFESGDELLILSAEAPSNGCDAAIASGGISASTPGVDVIWALDVNKEANTATALTDPAPVYIFIDATGRPYTNHNVHFRIIRSGKRNLLGAHLQAVTNMLVSPITGTGNVRSLAIGNTNNSSNVINASAIEYKERWQTDPDEIKTFVINNDNCAPKDLPSCDNTDPTYHMERSINPYCKGLLGNFSPDRNLVYYSNRAESNPSLPTNLQKNGFLDNSFALYWTFNGNAGMQPLGTKDAVPTSNWVFKSRTTRENARSMALETVDALNIYTAAQYGYNKTLPTAITNNAAYGEAAYDGFEDNGYNNSVNNASVSICPNQQYINFTTMANAQVVSAASYNINAHTGKNVLMVNPNSTAIKTLAVNQRATNTNFNLQFGSYTPINLLYEGLNVGPVNNNPPVGNNPVVSPSSSYSASYYDGGYYHLTCDPNSMPGDFNIYIYSDNRLLNTSPGAFPVLMDNFKTNEYIKITTAGIYTFNETFDETCDKTTNACDAYYPYYKDENLASNITVTAVGNTPAASLVSSDWHHPTGDEQGTTDFSNANLNNSQWCLQPGIYQITTVLSITDIPNDPNVGGQFNFSASGSPKIALEYKLTIHSSAAQTKVYSTTTTQNGCTNTTPIDPNNSANVNLMHPLFGIPAPKQVNGTTKEQEMVFSAWVHKDGAGINQTSYDANQVQLKFVDAGNNVVQQTVYNPATGQSLQTTSSTVTLSPAGPIIDGWQRYEGYFSAPPNAVNLKLSFVNSSSNNIYFDDIRIHPFNANMTSYVYDPITQRLVAQLDANNYASYYEYDEEGTLIRTKAETIQGIKTINETRSAKQKTITNLQ